MNFLRTTALIALFSIPAFADITVRNGKISANFTSQTLGQAVQTITKQSGIQINLDESVANETVSANFKDLPLAVGIKKMLEGTGINYAVIAGPDGIPSAVLISGSEKPGAPPKKLDTRPVTTPATYQNRSVVTPASPPPQPAPTAGANPQKEAIKQPPAAGNAPATPQGNNPSPVIQPTVPRFDPNNVPTAGSIVPTVNTPQQQQPPQKVDPRAVQDPDDDDDDEDEF